MFEKIVQYQNLDIKKSKLLREIDSLKEKQEVDNYAKLIKDNQNKLAQIDNDAKTCIEQYHRCEIEFEKLKKEIEKIKNSDLSLEQKNKWASQEHVMDKQLSNIERILSTQVENVNNIIKQFDLCKNNIVTFKNKYLQSKENYANVKQSYVPKVEEINKEMENLEKEVNQILLAKYKQLKQDKIFPVFVAVNNSSCGGCSMEFSSAHMTKLKQVGYLECEHCRRINYLNN